MENVNVPLTPSFIAKLEGVFAVNRVITEIMPPTSVWSAQLAVKHVPVQIPVPPARLHSNWLTAVVLAQADPLWVLHQEYAFAAEMDIILTANRANALNVPLKIVISVSLQRIAQSVEKPLLMMKENVGVV